MPTKIIFRRICFPWDGFVRVNLELRQVVSVELCIRGQVARARATRYGSRTEGLGQRDQRTGMVEII